MSAAKVFWYKHSPISYHRFGFGKEILVAFHGYNQTSAEYLYFEDILSQQFTVIAIDFFWHGQSEWREQEDFTEQDMVAIVMGIKLQEKLIGTRFSVCSFSMGARMARALVRSFPNRINYFILLSPPTFAFNTFLNFTTNNPLGLFVFQYFVRNNNALLQWVQRLNKWKILNRSIYVFTSKFIGNQKRMEKVFKTWYAQRKLTTNFDSFAKLLNNHQITTVLIVGEKDHITPPKQMIKYVKQLKNHKIFMLNKKHELATQETKEVFAQLFLGS